MRIKKLLLSFLLAGGLILAPVNAFSNPGAPAFPLLSLKDAAYQQCRQDLSSEFAKLLCLGDILKQSPYQVVYNGKSYQIRAVAALVSAYVRLNYRNEKAEEWIAKFAYRSATRGQILYLKDPQGRMFILKDVLLQQLKALPG